MTNSAARNSATQPRPLGNGRSERLPASLRMTRILALLDRNGFMSINDLAEEFGISGMTVRRDLAMLEGRNLLERTHGGATSIGGSVSRFDSEEPAFEQRRRLNADRKAMIARAAAAQIQPGDSVGLDGGTSVLLLAEQLVGRQDIQVFTNNLRVGMYLAEHDVAVYTLGGKVRKPEFSVVGPQAVESLAEHYFDRVFIGVSGLDSNYLYDYSPEDTEVKRALIDKAATAVVLCDSSKFNRRALSRVVPLERASCLITDEAPPADLAKALEAQAVSLVIADT